MEIYKNIIFESFEKFSNKIINELNDTTINILNYFPNTLLLFIYSILNNNIRLKFNKINIFIKNHLYIYFFKNNYDIKINSFNIEFKLMDLNYQFNFIYLLSNEILNLDLN